MTAPTSRFLPSVALVAIGLVGAAAALLLVEGPQLSTLAFAAVLLLPLVLYVALKWPLDALFGLYALLVPFDNVLNTGSFGTLTKLLGIVAGACLLLAAVRHRSLSVESAPVRVLFLLIVWMLASTLWAVDQKAALQILPTYAGLMLLYAVLTMTPITPKSFRALLVLVVAGGLCAAAYGAHAFYHNPEFSQESLNMRRLIIEVGGYHIDPNHFSDALLFPVAIVTMWALRAQRMLGRLACIAGLVLLIVAILLSGSREGVTAVAVIAAYYLCRSRYRARLAIGVVALAAVVATVQTSVFLRFASALETGGSGRTSIWAVALEAAKHRPLQGYGIGNFTQAFNLYYLAVRQPYPYGWDSPAHNLVAHYMVELGIVGLALIGAFFWAQFRSLRVIEPSNELYDYRIAMEAVLLAIVTVSMTIDLFQYKYAWLAFALTALLRTAAMRAPNDQGSAAILPAKSAMMPVRSARV